MLEESDSEGSMGEGLGAGLLSSGENASEDTEQIPPPGEIAFQLLFRLSLFLYFFPTPSLLYMHYPCAPLFSILGNL